MDSTAKSPARQKGNGLVSQAGEATFSMACQLLRGIEGKQVSPPPPHTPYSGTHTLGA